MSPTLRARSPNIMDDIVKRPPPSPSDKAPPQKKPDVKLRPASEETVAKAGSPAIAHKEKSDLREAEKKDEQSSKEDVIDIEVFSQILELDDDDCAFSTMMVNDYYDQVKETFGKMDQAMQAKDFKQISQLGHFLKGSSAALGVKQMSATCEKIQNTAKGISSEKTMEEAVMPLLKRVKDEYDVAKKCLQECLERHRREQLISPVVF